MANVIKTLAAEHEISLIVPSNEEFDVPEFVTSTLRLDKKGNPKNLYSPRPKIGLDLLGSNEAKISEYLESQNPDLVYWSHSYLPAATPDVFRKFAHRSVVEFANIEARRFRSTARASKFKMKVRLTIEAIKAFVWEPRIARKAALCIALSSQDRAFLENRRANVVEAANGINHAPMNSISDGYLLIFASMNYQPNVDATKNFVANFWPEISRKFPRLELVVAGRSADRLHLDQGSNLRIVSDPESQDDVYRGAIATIIPTNSGGGSQLKITESLQRNRLCLLTQYSIETAPSELKEYLSDFVFKDVAQCVDLISKIANEDTRLELESQIERNIKEMSWTETLSALLVELRLWPEQNIRD